ncbi:mitochondrial amidoxime reducing component 2-like protein [Tanacetum coccineum]
MANMNTRLNIEKLDGNIVQKHGGSKQLRFKQLGPGVETGVHGVHDEKRWLKDGWRTSNLKRRQTRTAWQRSRKRNIRLGGRSRRGYSNRMNDTTRSTYLVNRSPSSAIGFKKPIHMLGFLGNKLWRLDDVTSKVVLNMGFNESGEYKKTFIGSGVGTGSMQVLHGFDFEVEPQENVDQGAGFTTELKQREIYLVWRSSGIRVVILSKIHNEKLVQTLLKGNSTLSLSLEDSLSRDCDVEKNGKWSYIYAVGSQEYQVVCTRPDIASAGVDMLDGFDRGYRLIVGCARSLKANLHHMEALSTTKAGYMTFTETWKKEIWLKGLLTVSGYELRINVVLLRKIYSVIRAPEMDELKVSLCTPPQTCDGVSVWEWSGSALDEGQEASEWFTRYLGKPSRLVRFNQESEIRPVDPDYAPGHKVMFSDGYPFLLVSKGSLDSLNELLSEPVPINRFRPNILVDGCEPFSEDLWKEIKIGNLTFHGVKLCPRCKVPTINQENALSASEPTETLVKFRSGKVLIPSRKGQGKVYFGQNMVCEDLHEGNENIIRLEDPVDLEGHTASYGNKMYQI